MIILTFDVFNYITQASVIKIFVGLEVLRYYWTSVNSCFRKFEILYNNTLSQTGESYRAETYCQI